MVQSLSRYWWLLALRGATAVIFGILAFLWPGITLQVLVILFGAYVLVDGISSLITGISNRSTNDRWWVMVLEGLAGVAAGIIAFIWTDVTAVVLLYIIAAWAIITGVLEIVAAVSLRKEIEGEWALALSGLASIIFGVLLFAFPGAGALAVVWIIGAYAIVFGILLIYLALKVRNRSNTPDASQRLRDA